MGRALQPAAFSEGGELVAGHDEVVEHADVEQGQGLLQAQGQGMVGGAGFRVPAGVVVDQQHGRGLMAQGGFKWVEVPYKGASPAIADLLGGHVQLAALSVASGVPHIKGGKVRGLAVTSPTRSAALPDVPTVAESGFPGFDATGWLGIFVPNGTPPAVIARLQAELTKVMQKPEVQAQMITNGVEARWTPGAEFGAMIARENGKWHKIMRDAGIQPK